MVAERKPTPVTADAALFLQAVNSNAVATRGFPGRSGTSSATFNRTISDAVAEFGRPEFQADTISTLHLLASGATAKFIPFGSTDLGLWVDLTGAVVYEVDLTGSVIRDIALEGKVAV